MGEIVQQMFGNRQVDVHFKGGVYLVYMNAANRSTYPVTSEDMKCPAGAFPKTYLSLEEVQGAFPAAQLNVVGTVKESGRVVPPVTAGDLAKHGSGLVEVASTEIKPQTPVEVYTEETRTQTGVFYYVKLETLFRNTVLAWKAQGGKGKREKELKAFVNGIGKAIITLFPEKVSDLDQIVNADPVSDLDLF